MGGWLKMKSSCWGGKAKSSTEDNSKWRTEFPASLGNMTEFYCLDLALWASVVAWALVWNVWGNWIWFISFYWLWLAVGVSVAQVQTNSASTYNTEQQLRTVAPGISLCKVLIEDTPWHKMQKPAMNYAVMYEWTLLAFMYILYCKSQLPGLLHTLIICFANCQPYCILAMSKTI